MSSRTKKVIYIIYLIVLPVLFICMRKIYKQADIYTSRTFTPLNFYVSIFLNIITGVIIGADLFFVKNIGLGKAGLRLYKLLDAALLIVLYVIMINGLFYQGPILVAPEFLIAAGFQIITAFCPLASAKRHT